MRTAPVFVAMLLLLAAPAALARGGLNLFWNGCLADPVHATSQAFACDRNSGSSFVYASVVMPIDAIAVQYVDCYFDVQAASPADPGALPPWWQLGPGGCRNGLGLYADQYDAGLYPDSCDNVWGHLGERGLAAVSQSENRLHIRFFDYVDSPEFFVDVPADGRDRFVALLEIRHVRSMGVGACDGCTAGACIVFNEAIVWQADGTRIAVNFPAVSNSVTWQAGGPDCPQATPARSRTWGAVKRLYR